MFILLLIEPNGIEIAFMNNGKNNSKSLLIEPNGIEIYLFHLR